ncbi:Dip2/Utp12 family-domain-containing protein [Aspergillus coremiiformis]|uniref:Dip2/Utp12 family-domain-containing protein n=1 Tax=Aspergillus coremiiformis TaxID=138285 RepID=A0A5N6Z3V7_9EURO|nr:Dip2/Utp12 family-domain-containing protein [Aspergillus coremiiformis]
MGKKTSRPPASKTSSAASPAVSGQTYTGGKSSILRASFAPSEYQLALFASVIQGLDAQHLRVHDTNTGRLQCEHILGPKETVTSLDWGYYPGRQKDRDQQSKKKRKRHSGVNGAADGFDQGDIVVAFGTSASDIRMYSPTEDKIVGTLIGAHSEGVKDFKFTFNKPAQEGWSVGGDNKLVQWDLRTGKSTKIINLPSSSVVSSLARPLPSNPPVICASQTPYIIHVDTDETPTAFPAMRNSIHTLLAASTESASAGLFLGSDNDRYINVFDPESRKLVMNLVAEKEVSSLSLYTASTKKTGESLLLEKQTLAAVTDDGTIELFTKPFVQPKDLPGGKAATSLKAKGRQMTKRADSSIKITRTEGSDALVPVVTASFQGRDLVIACAEGGIIPVFERVTWLNEDTDELAFTGIKKIVKSKSNSVLSSVTTNSAKKAVESQVDESKVAVQQGNFAEDDVEMQDSKQDAISVADSDEYSDDDEQERKQSNEAKETGKQHSADSDVEMENVAESDPEEEDDETGEPSFGELMRANAAEIDVEAELEDDVRIGSLVPGKPNAAVQQIPSGVSLSTVLTQSLKTNDNDMLESCFHTGDLSIIRTTIQRLESSLAATLLQRLAERLSARPGRYGHLLVWIQWTCVAHGGALAGQPDLLKRMATLYKVMDQRSSSLPSLLLLKGKLDMLDAQLGLRQSIRSGAEGMESEDEDNVIYVEGEEELEEEDSDADTAKQMATPRTKLIRDQTFDEDESMLNGVQSGIDESEDEEDGSEEEDENQDVFDVEAEESAGSSDAEESLEEDEDDEDDDAESAGSMADFIADTEDDSEDEGLTAPPPPSKKAKLGSGGKGKNKARK